MNKSLKEIEKDYFKSKNGNIIKTYTHEEENNYYSFICKKISERYPEIVNFQKIYDFIKDKGHIVTIKSKGKEGFYDEKNDIIGIGHYLTKITTYLFHETVHKISNLFSKGKWKNNRLSNVYKEAGTEIITSNSLMSKMCKAWFNDSFVAICPNTVTSYYLETVFVNQLNQTVGNQELEKSILKGNDDFQDALEKKYGKKQAEELTKKIEDTCLNYFHYKKFLKILKPKDEEGYKRRIVEGIESIQDIILHSFDGKVNEVASSDDANKLLDELLEFSESRVRRVSEDGKIEDNRFKEYFYATKRKFKRMFPDGEFKQKFNPNDWVKKYSDYKEVEQISEEEKDKIRQEAIKRKKEYKKERFQEFLEKLGIGKRVSKLPEGKREDIKLNKIDFKYGAPVDISGTGDSEIRDFKNTTNKKSDKTTGQEIDK